jgi:DNA ligase-associated metallophosphoesterase
MTKKSRVKVNTKSSDTSEFECCHCEIQGLEMELHPLKALYIASKRMLVISDLHLGKSAHFRRNGIALPDQVNKGNHWNLSILFQHYQPEEVIFLGDLFHSRLNHEWDDFADFIDNFRDIRYTLIEGNHDILDVDLYKNAGIEMVRSKVIEGLKLTHEPEPSDEYYNLAGHIHPCVRLQGTANQGMRLACFYFGKDGGLMPAFGDFTGMHKLRPVKGDSVFVTSGKKVVKV